MSESEAHNLRERLAALEVKVNGGPGQSALCKVHAQSVEDLKRRITDLEKAVAQGFSAVTSKLQFWSGALAVLVVFLQIGAPLLRDLVATALKLKP